MLLKTFTIVFLRICALKIAFDAISAVILFTVSLRDMAPQWHVLSTLIFYGASSVIFWFFAPVLARAICKNLPESLSPVNASLIDLYSVGFLFIGLLYIVPALGPTIGWLYYIFSASYAAKHDTNFYQFFNYILQLLLGFIFVFKARSFSTRLVKIQVEQGAAANP